MMNKMMNKMKEENDRIRAEDLKNAEEEAEKERVRIEKETALKEKIERERLAFHTLRKRHEDIHQRSLLDYASTHAYEQVIIIITDGPSVRIVMATTNWIATPKSPSSFEPLTSILKPGEPVPVVCAWRVSRTPPLKKKRMKIRLIKRNLKSFFIIQSFASEPLGSGMVSSPLASSFAKCIT